MNQLTIIGNLTHDPESRTTQDGKTVCNFTVAVNRRKTQNNQNPEADFFRIAAWHQMGENCQKYLTKGKKVSVIGSVSVHAYQAQDGTPKANMEVIAKEIEFLSPKDSTDNSGSTESAQPNMTPVNMDGELPF